MRKKKVIWHSDFALAFSGFGRASKAILKYLWKTGKYDLVNYACGTIENDPNLTRTPWKTVACLPNDQNILNQLNANPEQGRNASYGGYWIDKVIQQEKPDVWMGVQDPWFCPEYWKKPWFNKITSVIYTTIDSFPPLDLVKEGAKNCKNYWVWSDFARRDLTLYDINHVKTVNAVIEDECFHKLSDSARSKLREFHNIPQDAFVGIFLGRNQLRKLFPNLLIGWKTFRDQNPDIKNARLILHTGWGREGWDIDKLIKDYKINATELLTTYICGSYKDEQGVDHLGCKQFQVRNYTNNKENCPFCGGKGTFGTTGVANGVSEEDLNKIYNLSDVGVSAFTSGGAEYFNIETLLTETPLICTNYSCGELYCSQPFVFSLEHSKYWEQGTQFEKASPYTSSIAKQLRKVYNLDKNKRNEIGKQGRKWALETFSAEVIGKQVEKFLDEAPLIDWETIDLTPETKIPDAPIPDIIDSKEWVKTLYKNILRMDVEDTDSGLKHWLSQIEKGMARKDIENFFRQTATQKNHEIKPTTLKDVVDDTGRKKLLLVAKESIGDLVLITGLLESIKEQYGNYDVYLATSPQYFEIFTGNPWLHKVIPYVEQMESEILMTGYGDQQGVFDSYIHLTLSTQRQLNYLTNNKLALI